MKENEPISWHPSFAAALQLELQAYADELEFKQEYELTSKPLKVDVLILKDKHSCHKRIWGLTKMSPLGIVRDVDAHRLLIK